MGDTPYKLIAIGGSALLPPQGDPVYEHLGNFQENGGRVILVSGMSVNRLNNQFISLGDPSFNLRQEPFIGYNGVVFSEEKNGSRSIYEKKSLSVKVIRELFSFARENQLGSLVNRASSMPLFPLLGAYDEKSELLYGLPENALDALSEKEYTQHQKYVEATTGLQIRNIQELSEDNLEKIADTSTTFRLLSFRRPEKNGEVSKNIAGWLRDVLCTIKGEGYTVSRGQEGRYDRDNPVPDTVDISGYDRGMALELLAEILEIDLKKEVLAIGLKSADVPMLERVNYGVVPEHTEPDVFSKATFYVPDEGSESTLFKAIHRYILGKGLPLLTSQKTGVDMPTSNPSPSPTRKRSRPTDVVSL